jgi:hypothetical protein
MTELDFTRLGSQLPNGATIIALSAGQARVWVILAVGGWEGDFPKGPYATWVCARPGAGEDTRAGHYFSSIGDAVEDYYERAGVQDELPHLG